MSLPPAKPGPGQNSGWAFAGVLVLIVLAISVVSKCTDRRSDPQSVVSSNFSGDIGNGVAGQPRQAPTPLSAESITRGATHVRLAMRDEGALGAQTYSQNCYDSLSRAFNWAKLDVCGAFDIAAIKALQNGDRSGLTQADYFESEVAAGRYLAAATGAGLEPPEADQRLSQLQSRAGRAAPAARRTQPKAIEPPPVPVTNESENLMETQDEGEDANLLDEQA